MPLDVQFNQHQNNLAVDVAPTYDSCSSFAWSVAGFPQTAPISKPAPVTLDLLHRSCLLSPSTTGLGQSSLLPNIGQRLLDLETGEAYSYSDRKNLTMSRRNGPTLDLKLNLSPPRANPRAESPIRSATVSPTSPPSSCVSSELNQDESLRYSNSPEATSMVLVGCPRCLMYVMLSEDDPKCPRCKSTVLLDFLRDTTNTNRNKKS